MVNLFKQGEDKQLKKDTCHIQNGGDNFGGNDKRSI